MILIFSNQHIEETILRKKGIKLTISQDMPTNRILLNSMTKLLTREAMYQIRSMFINLLVMLNIDQIQQNLMDQPHTKLSSLVRQLNKLNSKSIMPIKQMIFPLMVIRLMETFIRSIKLMFNNLKGVVTHSTQEVQEDLMVTRVIMT